jgi:hypothetical protein
LPRRPISTALPRKSAQVSPIAETARPNAVIAAPKTATGRIPMLSASRPITMPPSPVPSQTSDAANATTDRSVSSEAAIGFSPMTTMSGAP